MIDLDQLIILDEVARQLFVYSCGKLNNALDVVFRTSSHTIA